MSKLENDYQKELALVRKVFNTDDGKALLTLLMNRYMCLSPCCPPNASEGYGYYREGQNDMIRSFYTISTDEGYNDQRDGTQRQPF